MKKSLLILFTLFAVSITCLLYTSRADPRFYRNPARSATECRISASQRLPAEYTPRNHGNAVYTRITIPFGMAGVILSCSRN